VAATGGKRLACAGSKPSIRLGGDRAGWIVAPQHRTGPVVRQAPIGRQGSKPNLCLSRSPPPPGVAGFFVAAGWWRQVRRRAFRLAIPPRPCCAPARGRGVHAKPAKLTKSAALCILTPKIGGRHEEDLRKTGSDQTRTACVNRGTARAGFAGGLTRQGLRRPAPAIG
jgi:hypothetical protein